MHRLCRTNRRSGPDNPDWLMGQAFGARGTTALDRIEAFTRGYFQGLPGC